MINPVNSYTSPYGSANLGPTAYGFAAPGQSPYAAAPQQQFFPQQQPSPVGYDPVEAARQAAWTQYFAQQQQPQFNPGTFGPQGFPGGAGQDIYGPQQGPGDIYDAGQPPPMPEPRTPEAPSAEPQVEQPAQRNAGGWGKILLGTALGAAVAGIGTYFTMRNQKPEDEANIAEGVKLKEGATLTKHQTDNLEDGADHKFYSGIDPDGEKYYYAKGKDGSPVRFRNDQLEIPKPETETPAEAKKEEAPSAPPAAPTAPPAAPSAPPAETKKDAAPSAPPAETKKDAAPSAPPAETKKDAAPSAPPAETKKDAAPSAPPAETKKDAAPSAPPAETKKDAAPSAPPAEDKKDGVPTGDEDKK